MERSSLFLLGRLERGPLPRPLAVIGTDDAEINTVRHQGVRHGSVLREISPAGNSGRLAIKECVIIRLGQTGGGVDGHVQLLLQLQDGDVVTILYHRLYSKLLSVVRMVGVAPHIDDPCWERCCIGVIKQNMVANYDDKVLWIFVRYRLYICVVIVHAVSCADHILRGDQCAATQARRFVVTIISPLH